MFRLLCTITTLGWITAATLVQAEDASAPAAQKLKPVSLSDGSAELSPQNTRITFIGTHEGEPKPRLGGFSQFTGRAEVGPSGTLRGVTLGIDTQSLWTEIDRLTNHLKSPDFFSVREHPQASFRSISISTAGGKTMVKGELTLLGVTKSIEVPAMVNITDQGLTLTSEFEFDRRQFGMNYGQGQVKNEVTVKVAIGQPTARTSTSNPVGR